MTQIDTSSVGAWIDSTGVPQNPVRSPSSWNPIGDFPVPDPATTGAQGRWVQVLSSKPGRRTWTVYNSGANPCRLSNKPFPQQTGILLAAGSTWTEEVEDELWAECLANGQSTVLQVTETLTPFAAVSEAKAAGNGSGTGMGDVPYIAPILNES